MTFLSNEKSIIYHKSISLSFYSMRENENAKSTRYFVELQMIFYEISYHSENIKDGNKTKKLFFLITKEQVLIVSVEP